MVFDKLNYIMQMMYINRHLHEFTSGLKFFIDVAEENKRGGFTMWRTL
jgi:hypothetical protein